MVFFLLLIFSFSLLLLIKMLNEAKRNDVIKETIYLSDFPRGFNGTKVFFISDIHKRDIAPSIIEEVKGAVDLVIIAGDLTEKDVSIKKVERNIKKLVSIGPTYFVWGNNDYETNYRDLDVCLLNNGVKILDNTAVTFSSESGEELHLLGLDDMSRNRDNLSLAISDSGSGYKILVCHDPMIGKQIKKEHNIGLVLAGHTHGGQIRIFGYGIAPKAGMKDKGLYKEFISNGYGTSRIPLRLGAPAQTHILELQSKE
ncbi:metallophosphoesterase [Lottiidibacillus patelloidae]|uniref:Metallophosphoesterase n=1 Tax=Lottiidibacillus patelloidae TaxID=2670334 RepID=A0A263BVP8_9BACI|nr:metallophosphoesterase [Lottiidibacillus patelloidae]OZM57246.1 metallophosphoesterase [Lottiidibacillus patelloidae]